MSSAGKDIVDGTIGREADHVVVGKENKQEENHASTANYFTIGHETLRASFEEGFDEGMGELQRIIREISGRILLVEYRLLSMERLVARLLIGVIVVGAIILYKLYFGEIGVAP